MYKALYVLIFIVVFTGCSISVDEIKPSEKAFKEEDAYIMLALRAEQLKEYNKASQIFNILYERSSKKEYLYRSIHNDLQLKNYARVIKRIDNILDGSFDDLELVRMKVLALVNLKKLNEAKNIAIQLVKISQSINDYILVSDIYVKLSKYKTALKYLEGAYTKDYNEKILDKIAVILYVNMDRKKDAVAYLETHAKVHGCSKIICNRLLSIYSNENDIESLLRIYLKLYEIDKSEKIAEKIIQIYGYKKDYLSLISFLEENRNDDKLLLQVYMQSRDYKKAAPLAEDLYEETGEITYLGQSAIFEYEGSEKKDDSKMHKSVVKKLKKVLSVEPKAIYYNYLGYLLIDHSIDVKSGINYVQKALEVEPESVYYLDSIAWGYYKLGKCQKAYKIMKKIVKMDGGEEEEVQHHYKIIKNCIKTKKGNK